jgi:hypothetical protein
VTGTTHPEANKANKVRITVIIQDRFVLDTQTVTGREIKEVASIPPGFSLHRRVNGANKAVPDDEFVDVHDGDHFYAQPRNQLGLGHRDDQ